MPGSSVRNSNGATRTNLHQWRTTTKTKWDHTRLLFFKSTITIQSNIHFTAFVQQFSILAEKLAQEREEVQVQKKAQEKVKAYKVSSSFSFQNILTHHTF